MNHLTSYGAMLAVFAGILIAEPANACPTCGMSMAPISAAPPTPPSVRPPDVSGAVNSATGAVNRATSSAVNAARDNASKPKRRQVEPDRFNSVLNADPSAKVVKWRQYKGGGIGPRDPNDRAWQQILEEKKSGPRKALPAAGVGSGEPGANPD